MNCFRLSALAQHSTLDTVSYILDTLQMGENILVRLETTHTQGLQVGRQASTAGRELRDVLQMKHAETAMVNSLLYYIFRDVQHATLRTDGCRWHDRRVFLTTTVHGGSALNMSGITSGRFYYYIIPQISYMWLGVLHTN